MPQDNTERGDNDMKKYLLGTAIALALPGAAMAAEECGEISMAEMNWSSAKIVVATSKFLLEQGYGCDVAVVPSDTTPAVTSLAENNEPDIVPEMWPNSAGDVYDKLKEGGQIVELTSVLDPGGIEGWWICLLYTSPSPRDGLLSRMPSSA